MSNAQQNVWVRATMPQRYNGVQKGSGDEFEMLDSDADDSVALNMVTRLKPKDIPSAKPVVKQIAIRTMEPVESKDDTPASETETPTPAAGATDTAAQAPATAAPARTGTPQQRYPHRNMQARK